MKYKQILASKMLILLLGFEYSGKQRLPGIIIDLYRMYRHYKNLTHNVYLLTDMKSDAVFEDLRASILDGDVDSNVSTFIEDMIYSKRHILVQTSAKLHKVLAAFSCVHSQIYCYYTGHSLDGDVLMPSLERVTFFNIYTSLKPLTHKNTEIFFLWDCCGISTQLPFSRKNNSWVYTGNFDEFFPTISICSSDEERKSLTTVRGSMFTKHFLEAINSSPVGFLHKISSQYSSSLITASTVFPDVWGWVLGKRIYHDLETKLPTIFTEVASEPPLSDVFPIPEKRTKKISLYQKCPHESVKKSSVQTSSSKNAPVKRKILLKS